MSEEKNVLKPVVTDYNSFGHAVYLFNLLAGNLEPTEDPDEVARRLRNQAYRVIEEAQEIVDAVTLYLEAEDKEELKTHAEAILDGVIDTNVTGFGLLQIAGPYFKTSEAATLICQNNLSKFTDSVADAEETAEYHMANDVACFVDGVETEYGLFFVVKRDEDEKVLKPYNYQPVDLSGCLWEEIDEDC